MTGITENKTTDAASLFELGTWLGRRQAFGLIASRCTAADAECLKSMRDSGEYKRLRMTWDEFCSQKAGISRRTADRLITQLEEFGPNFFRVAELIEISPSTYRLIAGSVNEQGIEHKGQTIPLTPEHRRQVMEVVEAARAVKVEKCKAQASADVLCKRLEALLQDATELTAQERLVIAGALQSGARRLGKVLNPAA